MKKAQVVKFWIALHENTSVQETISAFANKKGYDSKATLRRYAEADAGFRGGQSSQVVSGKTGWSVATVDKIRGWWQDEFSKPTTLPKPPEGTVKYGVWGTPHRRKMRELTQNLMGEIVLPEVSHRFIVESKLRPEYLGTDLELAVTITENQEREVRLSTDEGTRDHLSRGLHSHLETGGFSDVLSDMEIWKSKVGKYLADCHGFLQAVIDDIEKDGKAKIPLDDKGLKLGFILDFPRFVCCGVYGAIMGRDSFPYKTAPHPFYDGFWVLSYGGYGIYVADNERELEKYLALHKRLIAKYTSKKIAKNLVAKDSDLDELGLRIIQRLAIFKDMVRLPGRCQLCQM